MHLSSWAKIVLEQYGGFFFFFGGMTLNNLPDVEAMLSGFWDKYQKAEGESTEHPTELFPTCYVVTRAVDAASAQYSL